MRRPLHSSYSIEDLAKLNTSILFEIYMELVEKKVKDEHELEMFENVKYGLHKKSLPEKLDTYTSINDDRKRMHYRCTFLVFENNLGPYHNAAPTNNK